jgi:hypothetical protein
VVVLTCFVMCVCGYVGVMVICALEFTVFYVVCTVFLVLFRLCTFIIGDRGGAVVKVLRYKSEGRWFDSRWWHWNFSLT